MFCFCIRKCFAFVYEKIRTPYEYGLKVLRKCLESLKNMVKNSHILHNLHYISI